MKVQKISQNNAIRAQVNRSNVNMTGFGESAPQQTSPIDDKKANEAIKSNFLANVSFAGRKGIIKSNYYNNIEGEGDICVVGTAGQLGYKSYKRIEYYMASANVNGKEVFGDKKGSHSDAIISAIKHSPFFPKNGYIEETNSVEGRDFKDTSVDVVEKIYYLDPGEHIGHKTKNKYSYIVHPD